MYACMHVFIYVMVGWQVIAALTADKNKSRNEEKNFYFHVMLQKETSKFIVRFFRLNK